MLSSTSYKSLGRVWMEEISIENDQSTEVLVEKCKVDIEFDCKSALFFSDPQMFGIVKSNVMSISAFEIFYRFRDKLNGEELATVYFIDSSHPAIVIFSSKLKQEHYNVLARRMLSIFPKYSSIFVFGSMNMSEYTGSCREGDIVRVTSEARINDPGPVSHIKALEMGNVVNGVGSALLQYSNISGHSFLCLLVTLRQAALSVECVNSFWQYLISLGIAYESVEIAFTPDSIARQDQFISSTELLYS